MDTYNQAFNPSRKACWKSGGPTKNAQPPKAMTTEKPVLFCAEMVRAILDGRKTMTRRVIKPQPKSNGKGDRGAEFIMGSRFRIWSDPLGYSDDIYTPWHVGTRLWVKETFQHLSRSQAGQYRILDSTQRPGYGFVEYAATPQIEEPPRWKPSIFMPRWASRIELEVTALKVERVQEITEADAIAEGFAFREHFIRTWDALNAKRGFGFDSNPWVFAYTFRRLKP